MEIRKYINYKIIRVNTKEQINSDYPGLLIPDEKAAIVKKLIEDELMPLWEQIKNRQPVKKVERFGNLLIEAGIKYEIPGLKNYGDNLVESIRSFNIEGIVRLVKLFPNIIDSINK
jgi:hypothetical protein